MVATLPGGGGAASGGEVDLHERDGAGDAARSVAEGVAQHRALAFLDAAQIVAEIVTKLADTDGLGHVRRRSCRVAVRLRWRSCWGLVRVGP